LVVTFYWFGILNCCNIRTDELYLFPEKWYKNHNSVKMRIERPYYLKQLIDAEGNNAIKIVTGLRRSGKSYLMFLN